MILFPDTNFFLHFRDPTEIPWKQVTTDTHIRIIICANTQVELDKKKFELRGRAKQRARKWVAVIGQIIATDVPAVLKEADPKITVELHLERPAGWTVPADLNATVIGDDSYVADVLAFRAATNEECALLSADTGPLGKAKRYGLPVVSAMRSEWELPEETDDRDKQIGHLKKALEEASKRGPAITATADVEGRPAVDATIKCTIYPPLTEAQTSALCNELAFKYPMITDIQKPTDPETSVGKDAGLADLSHLEPPFDWIAPTDEQITAYRTSYEEWLADAREIMSEVPASLQEKYFEVVLGLSVSNVGTEPATDVWISMVATGGAILRDDDKEGEEDEHSRPIPKAFSALSKALRQPPEPPRWKKVYRPTAIQTGASRTRGQLSDLRKAAMFSNPSLSKIAEEKERWARLTGSPLAGYAGISGMHRDAYGIENLTSVRRLNPFDLPSLGTTRIKPRDPEAFYWKDRSTEKFSSKWEFECKLLRHHVEPEEWDIPVVVRAGLLKNGAITVNIHASNLPKPTKITIPVRIEVHNEDTEHLIRMLLPKKMHEE